MAKATEMTTETRNTFNIIMYALISLLLTINGFFVVKFINATDRLQSNFIELEKDYGMWKADRKDMKEDVKGLKEGYVIHDMAIQGLKNKDKEFEDALKRNGIK